MQYAALAAVQSTLNPLDLTWVTVAVGAILVAILGIDLIMSAANSPSSRLHKNLMAIMVPLVVLFILSLTFAILSQ